MNLEIRIERFMTRLCRRLEPTFEFLCWAVPVGGIVLLIVTQLMMKVGK
jgi:hypothetical protein